MAYKFTREYNAVLFLNVVYILPLIDILSSLGQYLRLLRSIIAICIGSNDGMHFSVFIQSLHLLSKWPPFYCSFLLCCQFSPFASFLGSKFKQKIFGSNQEQMPSLNPNLDLICRRRPINYSLGFVPIFLTKLVFNQVYLCVVNVHSAKFPSVCLV